MPSAQCARRSTAARALLACVALSGAASFTAPMSAQTPHPAGPAVALRAPAHVVSPVTPPSVVSRDSVGRDSTRRDSTTRDSTAHTPAPHRDGPLSVHGYLTQGYAGLHGGVQFYGIRDRSSADFRYMALQGRYALTSADRVVLQINHRDLGPSPITETEPVVKLNWAFYEHVFADGTTVKAGRSPIPRGIYNQLRSVGVALPTYRPPVVFYDEGAYYSETIDGVVASHTFFAEAPWSVEMHAYGGAWTTLSYDTWSDVYSISRTRATQAIGGQVWLYTPLDGVRVGAAAQRYRVRGDAVQTSEIKEYHTSLDATRERGFVRSEVQMQFYGTDRFVSGYAQFGARLVGRLHGIVELQRSYDTAVNYGDGAFPSSYMWHRSDGVGVAYAFAPTLVAKLEHHWDRGIQLEEPGDPLNPKRFRYAILSLSTSF